MPRVILLTGPGGSGKTTIGKILESNFGYTYLDGDSEDTEFFPDGDQWLPENTHLLQKAHEKILQKAKDMHDSGSNIVVDYIIFGRYVEFIRSFRREFGDDLDIKVLLPSHEELVERDRERECWTTGPERIKQVAQEFLAIKDMIGSAHFIDTTGQTPEETIQAIL